VGAPGVQDHSHVDAVVAAWYHPGRIEMPKEMAALAERYTRESVSHA
jgi:hypothetical protein